MAGGGGSAGEGGRNPRLASAATGGERQAGESGARGREREETGEEASDMLGGCVRETRREPVGIFSVGGTRAGPFPVWAHGPWMDGWMDGGVGLCVV